MTTCKPVWPATRAEYDHIKRYGKPVMIVVNKLRRNGYVMDNWYVYESSRMYFKCAQVDRIVDPANPEG